MSWSSLPVEVELEMLFLTQLVYVHQQEAKGVSLVLWACTLANTLYLPMVVFVVYSKLCYDKLTYPQW